MTEKRFKEIISIQKVVDNQTGQIYDGLIDDELLKLFNELNDENEQLKQQLKENTDFLIRSAERLGFKSLDHLLYTLDKGEIYGYSTANLGERK